MEFAKDIVESDLAAMRETLSEELATMAGKRLLITGGAGFLGYYLVKIILWHNQHCDEGQQIQLTVWENYIRGLPSWLKEHENDPTFTLAEHDITNPLPENMGDYQFIIHAASIASPLYYRKFPIETMDANVRGLRYLLEYCRSQKDAGTPVEGFLLLDQRDLWRSAT